LRAAYNGMSSSGSKGGATGTTSASFTNVCNAFMG
jgi:hypothetical protein